MITNTWFHFTITGAHMKELVYYHLSLAGYIVATQSQEEVRSQ